jgi:pimeloyl-ACP methyl ester carboxylesterase
MLRTLRRWNAGRISAEAERITQPTLLIWGERDRDIPLRHGEHLHARMPNARLIVLRDCGHLPQEERPDEFAGLVIGFCNSMKDTTAPRGMAAAPERA